MGRLVTAALLAAFVVLGTGAPVANADPADHVPYCSGDQTPMDSNCRVTPSQIATHEGTGLTPNTGYGVDPDNEPAV